jgi:hypothetical protein
MPLVAKMVIVVTTIATTPTTTESYLYKIYIGVYNKIMYVYKIIYYYINIQIYFRIFIFKLIN